MVVAMYCIVVYDINAKRVQKMLKLIRKYLHWIQNSVFEGEISNADLDEMIVKAKAIMHCDHDSLIIFQLRTDHYLEKVVVGVEKEDLTSNFL